MHLSFQKQWYDVSLPWDRIRANLNPSRNKHKSSLLTFKMPRRRLRKTKEKVPWRIWFILGRITPGRRKWQQGLMCWTLGASIARTWLGGWRIMPQNPGFSSAWWPTHHSLWEKKARRLMKLRSIGGLLFLRSRLYRTARCVRQRSYLPTKWCRWSLNIGQTSTNGSNTRPLSTCSSTLMKSRRVFVGLQRLRSYLRSSSRAKGN